MAADDSRHAPRVRTRTSKVATREMEHAVASGTNHPSLVVIYAGKPTEITKRFVLDPATPSYLVGRSSECNIVLDSTVASRKHARVDHTNGAWWVVDLGSLNGTYVNDARITAHPLAHGDRIQIGDTIFKHLSGSDVEAAYAEAIRAALVTDGLTQAANERAFREQMETATQRWRNEGAPVSLVIADLDRFKSINDTHGHPAGDRVLREFVRIVRGAVPKDVLVARIGGEEFALLAIARGLDQARALAERARAAVEAHPFPTPAGTINVTASFGIAVLGQFPEGPTELFEHADQRMYEAKRGGRNRVVG